MVIQNLQLKQFRNYSELTTDFGTGINFVYGKNGQGKTNLIESLYIITHLKSFRTSRVSDLCKSPNRQASIQARIDKRNVGHEVWIYFQDSFKKITLDQQNIKYTSEYINNFISLLFAPDLLTAFKVYPLVRRNFIDRILFLIDPPYSQWIKDYNRARKQKNSMLRLGHSEAISGWDRLLSELIPKIAGARSRIVDQINQKVGPVYRQLTGRDEHLIFCYQNQLDSRTDTTAADIFRFLLSKRDYEIKRGYSCYGSHRDNYWMRFSERTDTMAFSQGEYRISFIALQLALNEIIIDLLGLKPVLLLDDIFSELDAEICRKTLSFIQKRQNQVFISSTEIPGDLKGIGKEMGIREGRLLSDVEDRVGG